LFLANANRQGLQAFVVCRIVLGLW